MPRPYLSLCANNDGTVHVVWHHNEFIDRDDSKMFRDRVPAIVHNVTGRRQASRAINNVPA